MLCTCSICASILMWFLWQLGVLSSTVHVVVHGLCMSHAMCMEYA